MELEDSYKIPNISILLKSKIPKEGQPDRKYIKIWCHIYSYTHRWSGEHYQSNRKLVNIGYISKISITPLYFRTSIDNFNSKSHVFDY